MYLKTKNTFEQSRKKKGFSGSGLSFRPGKRNPLLAFIESPSFRVKHASRNESRVLKSAGGAIAIPGEPQLSSGQGQHLLRGGCSPAIRVENEPPLPPNIETRLDFNQHIMPVVNCFCRLLLK